LAPWKWRQRASEPVKRKNSGLQTLQAENRGSDIATEIVGGERERDESSQGAQTWRKLTRERIFGKIKRPKQSKVPNLQRNFSTE
jgi:hypothetical protein